MHLSVVDISETALEDLLICFLGERLKTNIVKLILYKPDAFINI